MRVSTKFVMLFILLIAILLPDTVRGGWFDDRIDDVSDAVNDVVDGANDVLHGVMGDIGTIIGGGVGRDLDALIENVIPNDLIDAFPCPEVFPVCNVVDLTGQLSDNIKGLIATSNALDCSVLGQSCTSIITNSIEGAAIGSAFGVMGAIVGATFGVMSCFIFGCRSEPPADTTPPQFPFCPLSFSVNAEPGHDTAIVEWPTPVATDNSGHVSIYQISPIKKASGDSFPDGVYTVMYVARDGAGNPNICSFSFTVKVVRCFGIQFPQSGSGTCHEVPVLYGNQCTFTCDDGYDMIGQATQTCQLNGELNGGGTVTCVEGTCPALTPPANSLLDQCSNGYQYRSNCWFKCIDGFGLPTDGINSIACQANKTWSGQPSACVDVTPPVIYNCPSDMKVYLERSSNYAVATWIEPTATDNVDLTVGVTLTGPTPGSRLYIADGNIRLVQYDAVDSAGNAAVACIFRIILDELTCGPIHNSWRLNINCSDASLVFGTTCLFQCDNGYPLVGSNTTVCEKYMTSSGPVANWTEPQPVCEVIDCPHLNAPLNGSLACAGWAHGSICQMYCNNNSDLPMSYQNTNFNGLFVCQDTEGIWIPNPPVPDCTTKRIGTRMLLPGAIYYFSGDCSSNATQLQIKQTFISILNHSAYSDYCRLYPGCAVQNVDVTCGNSTSRKKRSVDIVKRSTSTYTAMINFDLVIDIPGNVQIQTPSQQLEFMSDKLTAWWSTVEGAAVNGDLDFSVDGNDLKADPNSVQQTDYASLVCPPGMRGRLNTFTCASCPSGTYYNSSVDDCLFCPIGSYQDADGQMSCKLCPSGYSTKASGARSLDLCIELCPVGFYSLDGVLPCSKCAVGSYQDKTGQMVCKLCNPGLTTLTSGSSSSVDCTPLDDSACKDNPCNNQTCVTIDGIFKCYCSREWTGDYCNISTDPCANNKCMHGATCIGQDTNYTCICPNGYYGLLCDKKIVDGHWGDWSEWTSCSVSCDNGFKQRTRSCTPAGPHGKNYCSGDIILITNCTKPACVANVSIDTSCPTPPAPKGAYLICNSTGTRKACNIICNQGRAPEHLVNGYIECGDHTNYQWSYLIGTRTQLPSCQVMTMPSQVTVVSQLQVPTPSCNSEVTAAVVTEVMKRMDDIGATTEHSGLEQAVTASCDVPAVRKKRSTNANTLVNITTTGTMGLQGLKSVSLDYLTIALRLENVTQAILNATESGNFYVTIGNTEYILGDCTHSGSAKCLGGMVVKYGFCVNCPPGTYANEGKCTACARGYYQSAEGQATCLQCPAGTTTATVGATNSSECVPRQCTSCGSDCSKKNWTQINYERLTSDWNVKLVGDTYNQDATNALKKSGTKVFLDDRTPLVLTFKSYICVRLVRFDVSCAASAEVRLMDVSSGKEVVQASGPIAGGPGWTTITQPIGPCCVNRIKIRVWPSNDPNCKPQALAAIRHVGVEYCADGCTPAP